MPNNHPENNSEDAKSSKNLRDNLEKLNIAEPIENITSDIQNAVFFVKKYIDGENIFLYTENNTFLVQKNALYVLVGVDQNGGQNFTLVTEIKQYQDFLQKNNLCLMVYDSNEIYIQALKQDLKILGKQATQDTAKKRETNAPTEMQGAQEVIDAIVNPKGQNGNEKKTTTVLIEEAHQVTSAPKSQEKNEIQDIYEKIKTKVKKKKTKQDLSKMTCPYLIFENDTKYLIVNDQNETQIIDYAQFVDKNKQNDKLILRTLFIKEKLGNSEYNRKLISKKNFKKAEKDHKIDIVDNFVSKLLISGGDEKVKIDGKEIRLRDYDVRVFYDEEKEPAIFLSNCPQKQSQFFLSKYNIAIENEQTNIKKLINLENQEIILDPNPRKSIRFRDNQEDKNLVTKFQDDKRKFLNNQIKEHDKEDLINEIFYSSENKIEGNYEKNIFEKGQKLFVELIKIDSNGERNAKFINCEFKCKLPPSCNNYYKIENLIFQTSIFHNIIGFQYFEIFILAFNQCKFTAKNPTIYIVDTRVNFFIIDKNSFKECKFKIEKSKIENLIIFTKNQEINEEFDILEIEDQELIKNLFNNPEKIDQLFYKEDSGKTLKRKQDEKYSLDEEPLQKSPKTMSELSKLQGVSKLTQQV